MKTVLKGAGWALLALVALVVGAALTVAWKPQLVLNDRNLERGARYAREHRIADVRWKAGHVGVDSLSLLHKRVRLEFDGLCVRMESAGIDGCFDRARVAAAASFGGFKPRVTELGPVDVRGGELAVTRREEPPNSTPPQDEAPAKGFAMPGFLRDTRVFPMTVELDRFRVGDGESYPLRGSFALHSSTEAGGLARIQVDTDVESLGKAGTKPTTLKAGVELTNPQGFWTIDTWKVAADARAGLPDGSTARVKADASAEGKVKDLLFNYRVDGSFTKATGALATLRASGVAGPDRLEAVLKASARGFSKQVPLAWAEGCKLALARVPGEAGEGIARADCPVRFKVPVPPKGFPDLRMPTEAGVRLTADVRTGAYPPSADALVDGRVGIEIDPILSPIFAGEGRVQSDLAGIPAEFPHGWKMDTDLAVVLRIPEFQRLVAQLADTPLDVWAPLRNLKGEIAVAAEGKFDAQSGTVPVRLTTRLASKKQKLDVDANGELKLEKLMESPKAHLDMEVALTDIQLALPPLPELPTPTSLKVDPFPRLFPDARIHAPITGFAKKPNSTFSYAVNIVTPEGSPVRLRTKLTKDPIPVGVKVALNDGQPPSGSIQVQGFEVELFKQQMQVEKFNLALKTPANESVLDGVLRTRYGDYNLEVLVLGTTAKPRIRFMSDPPLPEDQIVAVLLYGKKLESLDPDQTDSVGNTQAALASGALTFGALYLLSGTPIQRIDYDPKTQNVGVTLSLGEGTSLNVSEGGGEDSVGIRRRLSQRWAVTTRLNNPTDQTDRSVTALLEWAYQY